MEKKILPLLIRTAMDDANWNDGSVPRNGLGVEYLCRILHSSNSAAKTNSVFPMHWRFEKAQEPLIIFCFIHLQCHYDNVTIIHL